MSDKPISDLRRRLLQDMTNRNFGAKTRHDYIRHIETIEPGPIRHERGHTSTAKRGCVQLVTDRPRRPVVGSPPTRPSSPPKLLAIAPSRPGTRSSLNTYKPSRRDHDFARQTPNAQIPIAIAAPQPRCLPRVPSLQASGRWPRCPWHRP
jgi:hypothetical protein